MEARFCYGCMQPKYQSPVCEHCGFDERRLNEENQLPIGTVLQGQYIVGKVLGQGGFGITYIGWDRLLEIPVAIKEYFPVGIVQRDIRQGPEVRCLGRDQEVYEKHRTRFLQEARTLAQLAAVPEIVQVRNFFVQNNTAYIVMEYVQGITLKQMLRDMGRAMTVAEALEVMDPVLRGLQKVHERQLIHRDISPDNIMLPREGGVKLIDFGTAKNMDDSMRSKSTESVLKPGFAPLEQYNSRGNLGTWTDVYALSATFHYLLTGKLPPDSPTRIEEGEDLPLLDRVTGMTPGVRKTLQAGLAIRAADRIQTVAKLREGLYTKEPAVTVKPEKPPKKPPEKKPPEKMKKPDSKPEKTKTQTKTETGTDRKKKGPLAALLVFAVIAIAIALGVGGNKSSTAQNLGGGKPSAAQDTPVAETRDITLRVWAGKADQGDQYGWVTQTLEQFEQIHPEYNITWKVDYINEANASDLVGVTPGVTPDVFFFANDQLGELVEAGQLVELKGQYLQQAIGDTSSSVLNGVTHTDGGVYGFPVSPNTWYMWYNKQVFSEEDVTNLNTMLNKGVVAFPMTNPWYAGSFLFAAGGSLFGPEGNDASAGVDFTNGDCVRAAEFMIELAGHRNFVNDLDGVGINGMRDGTVHAMFSGSWDENYLREALGDDLGCAVLPTFTMDGRNYQMVSFIGSKAIGVNPQTKEREAAMELAAFMASAESQLLHYQLGGVTPIAEYCSLDPAIQSDARVAVEMAQATHYAMVQPLIPEMASYWDPMTRFGQDIVYGSITKATASRELYALMDEINAS